MKKYFLHDGTKEHGPYSKEELKDFGTGADTMVWYQGLDQWKKASEIDELNDVIVSKATPPPLAPPLAPPPLPRSGNQDERKKKTLIFAIIGGAALLLLAGGITAGILLSGGGNNSDEAATDSLGTLLNATDNPSDPAAAAGGKTNQGGVANPAQNQTGGTTAADEREKEQAKKIEDRKREIRNNYTRYYKTSCTFSVGPMGGISNGYVTVKNTSEYPIDKVNVAVNIYQATGGIGHTFYVEFFNIAGHGQATKSFPPFPRGNNAQTQISYVKASAVGL